MYLSFQLQLNSGEREVPKIYHSSSILPILDFVTDAKLNYSTTKVRKRVWKMACFGLKLGQDLGNWAAHPYREFRGVPPSPGLSDHIEVRMRPLSTVKIKG